MGSASWRERHRTKKAPGLEGLGPKYNMRHQQYGKHTSYLRRDLDGEIGNLIRSSHSLWAGVGVIHIGCGMDKVQFTAQGTATYPCGPVGWQYLNK